ncbi:SIMPL domain-containing protein [Oscillatoria salina]|uniref:SIMPL domain-containing protein n=1 Tax=Oscillatoria salina TaxID=331517 RepID=UPI0013B88B5A|nr:SIMPL domain-containing protein [Oscillatoria salina]MBZ8182139.1 SIMPL domain-containing protein [Oscillatoria salina IIICB1]NET87793.1 SIMPL domain-containing protein [Kamptonema sp. SIO1D9]
MNLSPVPRLPKMAQLSILAVSFSLFSSLVSPMNASAQERMLRTLTVTGQGKTEIPATLAQVQLGVEVQRETATAVQQEVARRSSALVEFLQDRNVEQLQTTGIQLRPNYDYRDNQRRLIGYIGTNIVSFRISTEQAGQLLDEAVEIGATRIDGINFTANDNAIAAAQKEALREATQDAQAQADTVLNALNLTREEIVGIQINGAGVPPIPQPVASFSRVAGDESTAIVGGEQTVRASVTLQISY